MTGVNKCQCELCHGVNPIKYQLKILMVVSSKYIIKPSVLGKRLKSKSQRVKRTYIHIAICHRQRKKDHTKGAIMWPNSSKIITNSFRGVLNFNHHCTQIGILRTKNIYLNDWILIKFFWLNRVVKRSHFFQKYSNELLIFFLKFKKFLITDSRHW